MARFVSRKAAYILIQHIGVSPDGVAVHRVGAQAQIGSAADGRRESQGDQQRPADAALFFQPGSPGPFFHGFVNLFHSVKPLLSLVPFEKAPHTTGPSLPRCIVSHPR